MQEGIVPASGTSFNAGARTHISRKEKETHIHSLSKAGFGLAAAGLALALSTPAASAKPFETHSRRYPWPGRLRDRRLGGCAVRKE
jgi:hypothetical protein